MDRNLIAYLLYWGDNTLVLGQRNAEWCGHGPVLEQDIAITNISLDLIGQARTFYQYAAQSMGGGTTEDQLAFLRDESEFRNLLLTELPAGDWAHTLVRQCFFSAYQRSVFDFLQHHEDNTLRSIAEKISKEIAYHVRWSREWVLRLGDGTEESHKRMQEALNTLWPYTDEFFRPAAYELEATAFTATWEEEWKENMFSLFQEATLALPDSTTPLQEGKTGRHTPFLKELLAEMQYLQRTYPGNEW